MSDLTPHHRAVYEAIDHVIDLLAARGIRPAEGPAAVFAYQARDEREFSVSVELAAAGYTLSCDEWYEFFAFTGDPVLTGARLQNQLIALLNGQTKLVVRYAGKKPVGLTLFYSADGEEWEAVSLTHALFFNVFAQRHEEEKRNRLLEVRVGENPFNAPD